MFHFNESRKEKNHKFILWFFSKTEKVEFEAFFKAVWSPGTYFGHTGDSLNWRCETGDVTAGSHGNHNKRASSLRWRKPFWLCGSFQISWSVWKRRWRVSLSNRCFWFTEENICETGVVKNQRDRVNLAVTLLHAPPNLLHAQHALCWGGGVQFTREDADPGPFSESRFIGDSAKLLCRSSCVWNTHTEKNTLTLTRKLRQWTRKQGDTCLLIRRSVTKVRRIKASLTFDF